MPNSEKLATVVAMLAERDEEFRPIENACRTGDSSEPLWPISDLKRLLGYGPEESLDRAVARAKIAAERIGISIRENFQSGELLGDAGETYVTKYAASLIAMNADPRKTGVALVQNYFALKVNQGVLEEEKRLRMRLDVIEENKNLASTAKASGVTNFAKFNGEGYKGLYGGLTIEQVARRKGLSDGRLVLEYAGSEELAANLFRITQTSAKLKRDNVQSENQACHTHGSVGREVRQAIKRVGGTMPELLPPAEEKIDAIVSKTSKRLS